MADRCGQRNEAMSIRVQDVAGAVKHRDRPEPVQWAVDRANHRISFGKLGPEGRNTPVARHRRHRERHDRHRDTHTGLDSELRDERPVTASISKE